MLNDIAVVLIVFVYYSKPVLKQSSFCMFALGSRKL